VWNVFCLCLEWIIFRNFFHFFSAFRVSIMDNSVSIHCRSNLFAIGYKRKLHWPSMTVPLAEQFVPQGNMNNPAVYVIVRQS
jgi:hypothetical protein